MDPKLLEDFKRELIEKKSRLEAQLSSFATKDPNLKDDWDAKYPRVPEGNIEEAADEVEEYSARVEIEHSLELDLRAVNDALERMERSTYGVCAACGNPISQERLRVSPEARLCSKCAT